MFRCRDAAFDYVTSVTCERANMPGGTHQEKSMKRQIISAVARRSVALVAVLGAPWYAHAQNAAAPYLSMAPLDQYLMADRNAEIALARSAAPESVARDAEVLVLGRHGYETAVKGNNGFVCVVQRSWAADIEDPNFWNPKVRSPACFNPQAARSYLRLLVDKTDWILAGRSKAQMSDSVKAAFAAKKLPALEPGAMAYMMSAQGYLNDRDGRWRPHLMFFAPQADEGTWGANLPGSPMQAITDPSDRVTVLLIPVAAWSNGTVGLASDH
jgi:hypothetical protein